jgi:cell division protein FtsI/penicillin-binding protein 2
MAAFRRRKTIDSLARSSTSSWRQYQFSLRKKSAARQTLKRLPAYLIILVAGILAIKGGFLVLDRLQSSLGKHENVAVPQIESITRSELSGLINPRDFVNPQTSKICRQLAMRQSCLYTTIDERLENSVISMMDPRYARQIGIVVMEPQTGKILAMASHDRNNPDINNCLNAVFPAASLFKIVSAAAAMEACNLGPDSQLEYNGGKYTLYKSQLTNIKNKYTNCVSLQKAFAESINPVFGKIGKLHLDKPLLEQYAKIFGFNREIDFDLPTDTSIAVISEKPYNWAEIACGFNKTTRISALHAAMIASAVINNGIMMKPYIIETAAIDNRVVFRQSPEMLSRAIHPETAAKMQPLMSTAVTRGTARSGFKGVQGSAVLSRFEVGGKTGSINDNPEKVKYDWFAGYARHKKTGKTIAAAVIVAHKDYIGVRAPEYFRKIVYDYMQHLQTASRTSQDSENENT